MIKPSELRCGNYVHPAFYSNGLKIPQLTVAKIITIDAFHVTWLPHDLNPAQVDKWNESKYFEIEPIPLTSDWLLKFGFKPIGTDDFHMEGCLFDRGSEFMLFLRNDGLACFTKYFCEGYSNPSDIGDFQSIHEMQNVFYFIEGEELTIQE